uniref:Tetratricopeptide repeat protein n=1 Tax=Plectus sambesii TaxID=2011161 RepID=A0A914XAD5_9BILA
MRIFGFKCLPPLLASLTKKYWTKCAEVFQCSLGADDPVLAFSYKEIGRCYAQFGKSALAERLYKRALSIIENSYGESSTAAEEVISLLIQVNKSQNRLKSADALGCRLKEMSAKRERSEKIIKRLAMLEKRRLRLSEAPETVRVLTQLGMMRYYYGELDAADELFNQALDMKIKLAGGHADPLELCREWQNLAAVAARRKDWRRATDSFRKVVEARDRKLGRTHHLTIASLRSFAQCLQRIERPGAELETVLRRLLDHYQAAGDSAQTVHTMAQLAAYYCRQGQHDRAEPLLERALAIAQSRLPDDHPAALVATKVHTKLHLDVLLTHAANLG